MRIVLGGSVLFTPEPYLGHSQNILRRSEKNTNPVSKGVIITCGVGFLGWRLAIL